MTPSPADTWGIPGPTFLTLYLILAALAAGAGFVLRARVIRGPDVSGHLPQPLTLTETAMLFDDQRPVLTGLAQLRGHQLIDSAGKQSRGASQAEKDTLDPLARTLLVDLRKLDRPRMHKLAASSRVMVMSLRDNMVKRGYLIGPQQRKRLLLAAVPLFLTFDLGVVRLIAGLSTRHPVGFLILALVAVGVCLWLVVRPVRLTRLGRATVADAVRRNSHLRPANSPAYSAYGPDSAALATALFGGMALWSLDPDLAHATNTLAGGGGGEGGSCNTSCSSGDSGSSCSSGSSCGSSCGGGCGG